MKTHIIKSMENTINIKKNIIKINEKQYKKSIENNIKINENIIKSIKTL